MSYVLGRLREPSTYAGLAALAGALGYTMTPEAYEAAVQLATAACGLLAILLRERGR